MSNGRLFCVGAMIASVLIFALNVWPGEPPHSLEVKYLFRLLMMFSVGCAAVALFGDRITPKEPR